MPPFTTQRGSNKICAEAGVRLIYLAPYSPNMNPIEEFFMELKTYIRKEQHYHTGLYEEDRPVSG
jgi:transposase